MEDPLARKMLPNGEAPSLGRLAERFALRSEILAVAANDGDSHAIRDRESVVGSIQLIDVCVGKA